MADGKTHTYANRFQLRLEPINGYVTDDTESNFSAKK